MPSKVNSSLSKSSSNCAVGNGVLVVAFIIGITLDILIIVSLTNIEKLSNCDCSKLPYRDYVKEWFTFIIFYKIVMLIGFSFSSFECWELFYNYTPIYVINLIIMLMTLIMIIRLFLYLREIRKNCNCAYGGLETFLYWFYLIYFVIILSLITLAIILGVITAVLYVLK
jgi:hypothetical protein